MIFPDAITDQATSSPVGASGGRTDDDAFRDTAPTHAQPLRDHRRTLLIADDEARAMVLEPLNAGAITYVRKGTSGEQIAETLLYVEA